MNIKSRLFKQPWEHKDPAIRAEAVHESDDPKLKAELGRLAEHDESATVRLAALKRINTEPFWLDARLRESDSAIIEAADAFLSRAVLQKPNPDMLKERREWFARIDDPELTRNLASHAPDDGLRADALERINAQGFLGDRYIHEPNDELADNLIGRIEQESTLQRIIGALRKTNKKRARHAERRLIEVRRAAGKHDPSGESARGLVEQVERLSTGDFDGDREQRLAELQADWESLGEVSDSLRRRFEGARDVIRRSLDHPATTRPGAADASDESGATAQPEAEPELTALCQKLQAAAASPPTDAGAIAGLLSEWDRAWNRIEQPSQADQAVREETLPAIRTLQKHHQPPGEQEPEDAPAASEVDHDRFTARLDTVGELLETGDIAEAQSTLRQLRSEHDRLKPARRPRELGGRLHRMEGRLAEMRKWQHWSNNKAREALITQIEELADSGQHPDAISVALKEARNEWRRLEKLEVLPGDKRRFASPPGQWRRFQAACKNAFDKAKPFFEKRHQVQEENLKILEAFVEKGNERVEHDEADGNELLQFMRKARQAIRRLDDLPPKTRGRSAAKLRELMDRLSSRLDAIYEETEQVKRRLVAEARELNHEKDLKAAIEKAKELQARWQRAGSGRRRIEQKLWKEFREPIDPLFEQLKGEYDEKKQQQQEAVAELEALCEQAEALAALDENELPEAEGRFRGLSDEWRGHERRPKALNHRFEQAERKFNDRLSDLRRQQEEASRRQIDQLAESIQAIWQKRIDAGPEALESMIARTDQDNELTAELTATARRFASPDTEAEALENQVRDNAETARHVVVELEFLAGAETPAEDRELRMEYQVQRLARRMGERDRQPDLETELEALTERWYRSFPHPAETHSALAKRFEKCQNVVRSMIGK